MSSIRLISKADVERLLDIDALIDALADAFRKLSAGEASVPPRIAASNADGLLAAMPGYLRGAGMLVKLVSVFPHNHDRGLPSHQAVITLFDETDGRAVAVMDGTAITATRTGATSALSVRLLAPPRVRVLAVLGAGVQGRSHLVAVPRVREFSEIRLASRVREHAMNLAREFPQARVVDSFEEAVAGADVVCCFQGMDAGRAVEIGELVSGARQGRSSDSALTVYKSMGHAVEDIAAAHLVFEHALKENVGSVVEL